jgi:hypothetical protein
MQRVVGVQAQRALRSDARSGEDSTSPPDHRLPCPCARRQEAAVPEARELRVSDGYDFPNWFKRAFGAKGWSPRCGRRWRAVEVATRLRAADPMPRSTPAPGVNGAPRRAAMARPEQPQPTDPQNPHETRALWFVSVLDEVSAGCGFEPHGPTKRLVSALQRSRGGASRPWRRVEGRR